MSETVTVLVAAFGGGLAGAVLQPVVTYVVGRIQSGEEIRRRRERSLRFMIEAEMDWANHLTMAADLGITFEQNGTPLSLEDKTKMIGSGMALYQRGIPPWNPDRVRDDELKGLVLRYYQSVQQLPKVFLLPHIDNAKVQSLRVEVEELAPRIRQRMDDLNWPEAEYWAASTS